MKKNIIGVIFGLIFIFSLSSRASAQYSYPGNTSLEYYDPYYGWYNPNFAYQRPNYNLGYYSFYGGGMYGNSYYGPTPFQRQFYGNYNGMRIRVGPNINTGQHYNENRSNHNLR